jgi:hypothetical protein
MVARSRALDQAERALAIGGSTARGRLRISVLELGGYGADGLNSTLLSDPHVQVLASIHTPPRALASATALG